MEETSDYKELTQELMSEIRAIGHALKPAVFNSMRGEAAVLMSLYRAGGELSPSKLGNETHVSSARIANILRTLEEKGFITRHHLSSDRRQVAVALTDRGFEQTSKIRAERKKVVEQYLSFLGKDDSQDLLRIARRTRTMLEQSCEKSCKGGSQACG